MKSSRRHRGVIAASLAAMAGAPAAMAQQDRSQVQALDRQMEQIDRQYRLAVPEGQAIADRIYFDAGASLRVAFFSIDDQFSDAHYMRQFDGRIYARLEMDGGHRFYGRLKFQYDDWNSGQSFDGEGDQWNEPFLDRLWYEFDLRGLRQAQTGERLDYNFNAKVGKEYFHWASGLVLSQNLYAAALDVEFGSVGVMGLFGQTSALETVDFDASRPSYDDNTKRIFAGGMLEWRGTPEHIPYAYFMAQIDNNSDDVFNLGGLYPTRFTYDSYYAGVGSRGSLGSSWRYRAEFAYEFGQSYTSSINPVDFSPLAQVQEDISAMAGLLGLTYLFQDPGDTRFDFELLAGSGDSDRVSSSDTFGGNLPGSDDTSFNSMGYVNTGLALAPDIANLLSLRAGISGSPLRGHGELFRNFRVGIDGFLFAKIDADAPISSVTIRGESFVGGEIDLFLSWRILSDLQFDVRYGLFLPGDAMPDGEDDPRQFVYLGMTYAF